MDQSATLRAKYADIATEVLQQMWAGEERMDWAETVLRDELIARGISATQLDDVALRREEIAQSAPPSSRDTIVAFGIFGRFAAILVSAIVFNLVGLFASPGVTLLAVVMVVALYVWILIRRVRSQMQHRNTTSANFWMTWQCVEASIVLLMLLATLPFMRW